MIAAVQKKNDKKMRPSFALYNEEATWYRASLIQRSTSSMLYWSCICSWNAGKENT